MKVNEVKKSNGEIMRVIDGKFVIDESSGCWKRDNLCEFKNRVIIDKQFVLARDNGYSDIFCEWNNRKNIDGYITVGIDKNCSNIYYGLTALLRCNCGAIEFKDKEVYYYEDVLIKRYDEIEILITKITQEDIKYIKKHHKEIQDIYKFKYCTLKFGLLEVVSLFKLKTNMSDLIGHKNNLAYRCKKKNNKWVIERLLDTTGDYIIYSKNNIYAVFDDKYCLLLKKVKD